MHLNQIQLNLLISPVHKAWMTCSKLEEKKHKKSKSKNQAEQVPKIMPNGYTLACIYFFLFLILIDANSILNVFSITLFLQMH